MRLLPGRPPRARRGGPCASLRRSFRLVGRVGRREGAAERRHEGGALPEEARGPRAAGSRRRVQAGLRGQRGAQADQGAEGEVPRRPGCRGALREGPDGPHGEQGGLHRDHAGDAPLPRPGEEDRRASSRRRRRRRSRPGGVEPAPGSSRRRSRRPASANRRGEGCPGSTSSSTRSSTRQPVHGPRPGVHLLGHPCPRDVLRPDRHALVAGCVRGAQALPPARQRRPRGGDAVLRGGADRGGRARRPGGGEETARRSVLGMGRRSRGDLGRRARLRRRPTGTPSSADGSRARSGWRRSRARSTA